MPMPGFFDLMTPQDLMQKLEREYARWTADPLNVDLAWNFFVTAEHLPDWLARTGPGMPGGLTITAVKRDSPLLRICSHIANGEKHFRPGPDYTSVDCTVREMTGLVKGGFVEEGFVADEPALRVYLTPDEQQALKRDAADVDALPLAAQVLEFWRQFPAFQTPSGAGAP